MLRLLALLCSLALMLAPLAPAQSGCAMVEGAGAHTAHGVDRQMPASGHPAHVCKQLCAVAVILIPPADVTTPSFIVRPAPLRVAQLIERERPAPSERPPKGLV
ncbi:hypothetical protein [Tabrizicola sp.]|uniref:hypothetical protein n=1 Tax=Tabrizicola sp. TaxID=2005166 RepID=UPI0035AE2370